MTEDKLRNVLDKATLRWGKWQSVLYREAYRHHGKTREEVVALSNYYEGKVDAYTEILRGEI